MKKIHVLFIVASALLLTITTLWGWGNSYISQNTIPPQVQLSAWHIGSYQIMNFYKELQLRLKQLNQTTFIFNFNHTDIKPIKATLAELGISYHAHDLLRALKTLQTGSFRQRLQSRMNFPTSWALQFQWQQNHWTKKLTPNWEVQTFGTPVNAQRNITSQDGIHYIPEKNVLRIDRMQLEQLIRIALPHTWQEGKGKFVIDVPLKLTPPPVTVTTLQAEGIERKIMEISTKFVQNNNGHTHNIMAAAQTIHNMIIKPDHIFDYNEVMVKAKRMYGFKEAPIIVKGKLIPGIGGGICQVSSTLYNAALRTGLEIIERRNHSLPVSYLPIGLDATFAQGYINFKFKNTTGKSLLIRTTTKNDRLIVKFFGTMDQRITYKVETKIVKLLPPIIKYVKNPYLPPGVHEMIQQGKYGYKVECYRITLINGEKVDRKHISTDTYRPQPTLIAVNIGERIEDGL